MIDLTEHIEDDEIRLIAGKVRDNVRVTPDEGLALYMKCDLPLLAELSSLARERINGNLVSFNRNFHVEPTNRCIYNCLFCAYHKPAGDPGCWDHDIEDMLEIVKSFDNMDVTEVHIVGGVHPERDIDFYCSLLSSIKNHRPSLHIKAFSAIELDKMITKAGLSVPEGLSLLREHGLDSIPGGGAEIFDEEVRAKICNEKTSSERWLSIHENAHLLGIPSNATMLYGHVETYAHRIDHMKRLRDLQDKTAGFNAFIPLKFRKENNPMSYLGEVSIIEELREYAVARIFLDNFNHIKAYWPMTGKETAQFSLFFGVDDIDGTIHDTTRIYSMSGAKDKNPSLTVTEISSLANQAGLVAVERDSLYNFINTFAL